MAVTVVRDLIDRFDGSSTTGWNTAPSISPDSVTPRLTPSSVSWSVGIATSHFWRTFTALNLQNTNIYAWMYSNVPNTLANGGYRILLGDGTNQRAYYVGGSDRTGFQFGAWSCMMLDTRNLPTAFAQLTGANAPNLAAITQIGVGYNHLGKAVAGALTCHCDIIRSGNGLFIRGGTALDPGTFLDIATLDASTAAGNAFGIIRRIGEGLFGVQGSLIIGDNVGTTTTYFQEENSILFFESNGAGNSSYKFEVVGNTVGTNVFTLGEKLGTGDDAIGVNGCTIQSAGPHVNVNFTGTNVNTLNIYGTTLSNLGSIDILLSDNVNKEFIGNTVTRSGMVLPNSSLIRGGVFSQTQGLASILWQSTINIKNSNIIANSVGIRHTTSVGTPYSYDNLIFNGNTTDIANASGSPITINSVNGSNPVTFTGTVTINNPITFSVANLISGTEVRLFRASDRVELAGIENSGTLFEYQYNFSGNINTYLVVHKPGYEYIQIEDIIIGSSDQTITVQQRLDRNFIT
jgi:hypothetical protein